MSNNERVIRAAFKGVVVLACSYMAVYWMIDSEMIRDIIATMAIVQLVVFGLGNRGLSIELDKLNRRRR